MAFEFDMYESALTFDNSANSLSRMQFINYKLAPIKRFPTHVAIIELNELKGKSDDYA